ncbi:MAG TPA: sigma-54 dependent transcriptional regulator [Thermoanaerobaculia bacterium]|nr:sigma-54 dependent transcriptional regulator [Thermoanaerobaculia bacterium]
MNRLRTLLLVDDDAPARAAIRNYFRAEPFEIIEAFSCTGAEHLVAKRRPDAVLLDYQLPDGNALDVLPRIRELAPHAPVIVLTGHGTIELAVQAMKLGAEQFLTKPVQMAALKNVLMRALGTTAPAKSKSNGIDPFAGTSEAIRELARQAERLAGTPRPVLIQGETGVGKTVLARWLHERGPRSSAPFVDLNCAGLSREFLETELFGHEKGAFTGAAQAKEGLLDAADGGTLFLDEVGDVDLQVQPKLLKALEERRFRRLGDTRDRTVDVHLIAATHQDLPELVRQKRFREDLFFRINTLRLRIPSLRERAEDVPMLAEHFARSFAQELGRPPQTLSREGAIALQRYVWPGNIRQLRNVMERAVLLTDGDVIERDALELDAVDTPVDEVTATTMEDVERQHIEQTLRDVSGKVTEAARILGIPRSTLYKKLRALNISARA